MIRSTSYFRLVRLPNRPGFSILEMLIYTGILGIILATTIYVTTTMYNVRARVSSSSIVHETMEFAQKRITSALYEAVSVTTPSSGSSSTLELVMQDAEKSPTRITFVDGQIWMKEGAEENLPLTTSEVEISELEFTRGLGTPPVVRIVMSGDRKNAKASYSAPLTLTTSAIIRLEE